MHKQQAYDQLTHWMESYAGDVYRCCLGMLHDRYLAQDASQETFLRAFRKMHTFKGKSTEKTWLLSISINVCRDMLRKPYARRVQPVADIRAAAESPPESPLSGALFDAIQSLPEKQRAVILLYYYHDLSCEEVANALRITRGTVFSHLKRARQSLTAALSGKGGEPDEATHTL